MGFFEDYAVEIFYRESWTDPRLQYKKEKFKNKVLSLLILTQFWTLLTNSSLSQHEKRRVGGNLQVFIESKHKWEKKLVQNG